MEILEKNRQKKVSISDLEAQIHAALTTISVSTAETIGIAASSDSISIDHPPVVIFNAVKQMEEINGFLFPLLDRLDELILHELLMVKKQSRNVAKFPSNSSPVNSVSSADFRLYDLVPFPEADRFNHLILKSISLLPIIGFSSVHSVTISQSLQKLLFCLESCESLKVSVGPSFHPTDDVFCCHFLSIFSSPESNRCLPKSIRFWCLSSG